MTVATGGVGVAETGGVDILFFEKMKRTFDSNIDWADLVCPISHELPTEPVVAEDGKVYDQNAWQNFIKATNCKSVTLKSPWSRKRISKKVYFSTPIKQIIQQAVCDGHVPEELCASWKEKLRLQTDFRKLQAAVRRKPSVWMEIGDHYYNGTGGVTKDLQLAYESYEKGWKASPGTFYDFHIKMTLLNTLRSKRSKTDVICSWTSLCKMLSWKRIMVSPASTPIGMRNLVLFTVNTTLEMLSESDRMNIRKMSLLSDDDLTESDVSHKVSGSDLNLASSCAKELAGFLESNAEDHFDSEVDESEDDDDESSDESDDVADHDHGH